MSLTAEIIEFIYFTLLLHDALLVLAYVIFKEFNKK